MSPGSSRRRGTRCVLIALLVAAVAVLGVAVVALLPMLTHSNAGSSGQETPEGFPAKASATGADGRERMLSVETPEGAAAELQEITPGDKLVVSGSGFDAGTGIYVSICAIPDTREDKPGPCLGGIPEGATEGTVDESALSSAWITNDWAWRMFATQTYDDPDTGSFSVTLTVPEPAEAGIDCRETRCAITTRADHTASSDRVQDILLPVHYGG